MAQRGRLSVAGALALVCALAALCLPLCALAESAPSGIIGSAAQGLMEEYET